MPERSKKRHPNFGENLKKLRDEYDVSREEVIEYLGKDDYETKYPNHIVGSWELGKREPSLYTVCKIAEFFGCSTDRLLGMDKNSDFVQGVTNILVKNEKDLDDEEKRKILKVIKTLIS